MINVGRQERSSIGALSGLQTTTNGTQRDSTNLLQRKRRRKKGGCVGGSTGRRMRSASCSSPFDLFYRVKHARFSEHWVPQFPFEFGTRRPTADSPQFVSHKFQFVVFIKFQAPNGLLRLTADSNRHISSLFTLRLFPLILHPSSPLCMIDNHSLPKFKRLDVRVALFVANRFHIGLYGSYLVDDEDSSRFLTFCHVLWKKC